MPDQKITATNALGERVDTARALHRICNARLRLPRPAPANLRRDWYSTIQTRGVVIVPGFYTRDQCLEAKAELQRLEQAYPTCVHRRSDRRLFGVNRASASLRQFAEHPLLVALSRAFYRVDVGSCITLGAHLPYADNNRGSGEGWHRDSLAPQFKAILYLTDVSADNGPFEIIPGSHRVHNMMIDIIRHRLGSRIRLEDSEVHRIQSRYAGGVLSVTGLAGTLVLANSSAIHRGKPIAKGERVALTNYYYPSSPLLPRQEQHFAPLLPDN